MNSEDKRYQTYVDILREELIPAMGCTEPIAIAYGAAVARQTLGAVPDKVLIEASGNIIKNVKSVIVPNTGKLKGIESAAAAGIIAGDAKKQLEVISEVTEEQRQKILEYKQTCPITVKPSDSNFIFDIIITVWKEKSYAKVRIVNYHTNIVLVEKNGVIEEKVEFEEHQDEGLTDRSLLTIEGIVEFANTVDLNDVRDVIKRQIEYNMKIAEEGLNNSYGANIGKVILQNNENTITNRAKAMAAAASDARMNGCELPVIIVSGSGNQGITSSVPVIEFAKELNISEEKLYRALVLSNLVTIHQKTGIGRLSAYCGAVSAGCGSGAGIAYLHGGGYDEISHTIVNSVAILSGTICDGAKSSCAAKIALAVEAGILGFQMYKNGQEFVGGDGIVSHGVENTIANVGTLARDGMKETDKKIIHIMTK
ncbi:L-cysteine desulfidase family protein [Velocimicrobium porci]|uniref:UPF0597 protein FYJ58_13365 n=1 Tax=Velocimicrobium porci TaxID=2606634 RepID=A0A6L5Y1B0_9FIRM|nr:L-serine ammonia-lyase, iron-sulfur-dependent, subunit alpha [Velocimicrobium porci]MSS64845.1 serine dehydratase subunit alpha family protein [Velocimicrobium porci]